MCSQINDMFIQKEVTTLFRSSAASKFEQGMSVSERGRQCARKKKEKKVRETERPNHKSLIDPKVCSIGGEFQEALKKKVSQSEHNRFGAVRVHVSTTDPPRRLKQPSRHPDINSGCLKRFLCTQSDLLGTLSRVFDLKSCK